MLRDVFTTMRGIENFGLISTIIFVGFFAYLLYYAITFNRKEAEDYSHMPLDDIAKESDDIQNT